MANQNMVDTISYRRLVRSAPFRAGVRDYRAGQWSDKWQDVTYLPRKDGTGYIAQEFYEWGRLVAAYHNEVRQGAFDEDDFWKAERDGALPTHRAKAA